MDNKVANFMFHYSECEKLVQQHIELIENSDIFDIGSNVGFFTESIVKTVEYKSIHLFEPSVEYFEYSKCRLSGYNNLYFNNYGLSDIDEKKLLYKCPGVNIGWNTFLEKDPNQQDTFIYGMDKEECILKNLDAYSVGNVDLIKIDVEGFEHRVLSGALKMIEKHKPYILIEVGWGTNHPEWPQCETVYKKLFDIGYKTIEFTNHTEDILFTPVV